MTVVFFVTVISVPATSFMIWSSLSLVSSDGVGDTTWFASHVNARCFRNTRHIRLRFDRLAERKTS